MAIENPFLKRAKKFGKGSRAERKLSKRISGRLTPASGALDHAKGDIRYGSFLVEVKSTIKDSLSLKHEWLRKITKEALDTQKTPAVAVVFTNHSGDSRLDGSWVLIPERVFKQL